MRYRLLKAKGAAGRRLALPWILIRYDGLVIGQFLTGAEAITTLARVRRGHG